jgi:hypothetical protein
MKCEFTERDQPFLAACPGLEAGLEEQADRALEVDQRARVLEREAGLAVDEAPHDAVQVVGAGEEGQLADGVEPAIRKPAAAEAPDPSQVAIQRV